jgi:hypothetical protein
VSLRSWLLALLALAAALLVQTTALARLPLPGSTPTCCWCSSWRWPWSAVRWSARCWASPAGCWPTSAPTGSWGRTALVLALVGYAAGLAADERGRSLPVVGAGRRRVAATAVVVYALQGLLLGDARSRDRRSGPLWAARSPTLRSSPPWSSRSSAPSLAAPTTTTCGADAGRAGRGCG